MQRIAGATLLFGAGMGGLGYAYSGDDSAPTFLTAPVERGAIVSSVRATGTVEAVTSVDVSSQLSGRMADVFVSYNDLVKAGQPIAKLDQEIYVARVNEAKAALKVARATAQVQQATLERAQLAVLNARTAQQLAEAQSEAIQARQDEAERELQRKAQLARRGYVADRELSQARAARDSGAADLHAALDQVTMKEQTIAMAEAELHMAEANLQNAQAVVEQRLAALDQTELDLERTVLRAPIEGVIIKREVNPGQTVAVTLDAKTLFTIANDLSEMEVHGKIDEADVGRLKVGQTAHFTVDAYPERVFTGRVLQIRKAPDIEQNVVTYSAIISAPNPDLLLLPGMTAVLRIVISDTRETLKIPNQALRFRPNAMALIAEPRPSATAWVVGGDGRPSPVPLEVGVSDDASTQLLAGALTEGQPVIIGVANGQSRTGFFGIRLGF
jgi:HlyD family secretion protein